jgi:hypothetical protein
MEKGHHARRYRAQGVSHQEKEKRSCSRVKCTISQTTGSSKTSMAKGCLMDYIGRLFFVYSGIAIGSALLVWIGTVTYRMF